MKPLYLELQAFGPYVEKQTVDFQKLSEKGIFLIKGKTGSGKTTVFDAMTFALYGGGSGENEKSKNGRNDLEEWRCSQADDNIDTYVSFTFSVYGRKYRFTRKLVKKRVKFSAEYEAGEIDEEGNVIPFFENPKKDSLTEKAEELIGLSKEQFRQVVLLPQGQFEIFLTASSKDKEKILQNIFESEKWEKYAEKFFDAAQSRKVVLSELRAEIQNSLNEENIETLEELEKLINQQKKELEVVNSKHDDFKGEEKQKQLVEDISLFEQFKSLHELERERKKLVDQKDEFAQKKVDFEKAEKAEVLRSPVEKYERFETECLKREKCIAEYMKDIPNAEENFEKAKNEYELHNNNSPVEMLSQKLGEYAARETDYKSIKEFRDKLDKANENCSKAEKEYEKVLLKLNNAKKNAEELFSNLSISEKVAKEFRDGYFSGIYGEIANDLAEGEKCPVCGSVHHPELAVKIPNSISKEQMEKMEKQAERARKIFNEANDKREIYERLSSEKEKNLEVAKGEKSTAISLLKNVEEKLIDGIIDYDMLIREEKKIRKEIEDFCKRSNELNEKVKLNETKFNELKIQIKSAEKEKETAKKELILAKETLDSELKAAGYPNAKAVKGMLISSEKRKRMQTEIIEYDKECRDIENKIREKVESLIGKAEPDNSKFEVRQKEISDKKTAFIQKRTQLKSNIDRLSDKFEKLSKKNENYKMNIVQADEDFAFAKKLRGDTGIGIQRYVLAIMFNQVIAEANRMLEKVHGGRYRLFRTDDKESGNKRGLELRVHDNRSPHHKEGRSVDMLSGGEKFLVSLALSIGMSTIAQNSGMQIEALFIDEGFGTLDESSIQDAMCVLDNVRKGSGMIGIISHVPLLEANIPTHLEIIKNESGSKISVV